jgi:uncharacterized protein (TIGR02246 family)
MSKIEDVDEIRQLIARYSHLVDSLQIEPWVECFTEDGVLDLGDGNRTEGRDALRALGAGLTGVYEAMPMRHVVVNVMVDVDGDAATSQSYLLIVTTGEQPTIMTTGVYRDRLRRADGKWSFVERVMDADNALPSG